MNPRIQFKRMRSYTPHVFLIQHPSGFALLCACLLLLPGPGSRAYAGADRKFAEESCSELVSRIQEGKQDRADVLVEDTWVSWTGTVVAVEQTLWGIEVRMDCADQPTGRGSIILPLDAQPPPSLGLTVGKRIRFTGRLNGPFEDGHITIKEVEFTQEPEKTSAPLPFAPTLGNTPPARGEPAPAGSRTPSSMGDPSGVAQQGIAETIRTYYQAVQMRQVDKAISLYAALKRPSVKRHVLEAIARDTQYYAIDRIQVRELGPAGAKATVELRHKKLNMPEEYWEVWMELQQEEGAWRILATPGRRVR